MPLNDETLSAYEKAIRALEWLESADSAPIEPGDGWPVTHMGRGPLAVAAGKCRELLETAKKESR